MTVGRTAAAAAAAVSGGKMNIMLPSIHAAVSAALTPGVISAPTGPSAAAANMLTPAAAASGSFTRYCWKLNSSLVLQIFQV